MLTKDRPAVVEALYQYLTAAPNVSGEIKWNFTKFLIARFATGDLCD